MLPRVAIAFGRPGRFAAVEMASTVRHAQAAAPPTRTVAGPALSTSHRVLHTG